jgi:hypothetical protein
MQNEKAHVSWYESNQRPLQPHPHSKLEPPISNFQRPTSNLPHRVSWLITHQPSTSTQPPWLLGALGITRARNRTEQQCTKERRRIPRHGRRRKFKGGHRRNSQQTGLPWDWKKSVKDIEHYPKDTAKSKPEKLQTRLENGWRISISDTPVRCGYFRINVFRSRRIPLQLRTELIIAK